MEGLEIIELYSSNDNSSNVKLRNHSIARAKDFKHHGGNTVY